MRLFQFQQPFKQLNRLFSSFSVRTRIVVLALVPVAGFIANGFTYVSGERDVGTAFATVKRAGELADASRDFKIAIASMRILVKDFVVRPTKNLVVDYDQTHMLAIKSLDTIESATDRRVGDAIASLRKQVINLKDLFKNLVREQNTVGYDEGAGLRGRLRLAGNAVERIINENMTWLDANEANKLMMSLLSMRQHEADYRLTQQELTRQQFLAGYQTFNNTFAQIDGTPEMKAALEMEVKHYADTFARWSEAYGRVRPLQVVMDLDSESMMPRANEIISQARTTAAAAASALAVSQARTRNGIIAVGIGMVALGLGFSWLIGRSITRPLDGLAGVMKQLAAGDTSALIPATQSRDEIGDMARTVIVFRDTMIEGEQLAASQAETSRMREQRNDLADYRAVQAYGRERPRQAARGGDEAGDELVRSQQNRRYGVVGSPHRRAARHRRLRQCHHRGELG